VWHVLERDEPPDDPVVPPEIAAPEQAVPPQQPDDLLSALFSRWLEIGRLLADQANLPDEVARLEAQDEHAYIVGKAIDLPAFTLTGWRVKANILDRLIRDADDPIHDLATSLVNDLLRGEG